MRVKTAATFLILVFAFSLLAACTGRLTATPVTLDEAQSIFEAAKFTGAATKSPYEYFSAEIFLKKAAEEMNLGNDKQANIYLLKGHELARTAYENSKRYQRSK